MDWLGFVGVGGEGLRLDLDGVWWTSRGSFTAGLVFLFPFLGCFRADIQIMCEAIPDGGHGAKSGQLGPFSSPLDGMAASCSSEVVVWGVGGEEARAALRFRTPFRPLHRLRERRRWSCRGGDG